MNYLTSAEDGVMRFTDGLCGWRHLLILGCCSRQLGTPSIKAVQQLQGEISFSPISNLKVQKQILMQNESLLIDYCGSEASLDTHIFLSALELHFLIS